MKIANAVILFERVKKIECMKLEKITSTFYIVTGSDDRDYTVDIANNVVDRNYPDPDYS